MPLTFETLRSRHPVLTYRAAELEHSERRLTIRYDFRLGDSVTFRPAVEIPIPEGAQVDSNTEALAFQLGMVELISYWKAACPPRIVVEAGALDESQIRWWTELFKLGLGEFFFRNRIDPATPDLITISSNGKPHLRAADNRPFDGDLVMVGGGKDSTLTLELLRKLPPGRRVPFVLNPIRPAIESVGIAGYGDPLIAKRAIDPALLELNRTGYLNGHTPFSAYLAFLGVLTASLHQLKYVIVSNEQSANEQNVSVGNFPVNHQYSKTTEFERHFREYAARHLHPGIHYFSFLRPIHDLGVSRLFATHCREHFRSFLSCNAGQKADRWCGRCAKCAFVYLTLFPYLGSADSRSIFGADLFDHPEIIAEIRALCGLTAAKPFECVGTVTESREALSFALNRLAGEGKTPPKALSEIANELSARDLLPATARSAEDWTSVHFLPGLYEKVLRGAFTA